MHCLNSYTAWIHLIINLYFKSNLLKISNAFNFIYILLTDYFLGWLELFWFPHRCIVIGRVVGWGCLRSLDAQIFPSTSCVQTGEILEISQWHLDDHDEHRWGALQSDLCLVYHHLYLRCDGDAVIWKGLRSPCLLLGWLRYAKMELHRFHAQVKTSNMKTKN